jgi:hypothetical protein
MGAALTDGNVPECAALRVNKHLSIFVEDEIKPCLRLKIPQRLGNAARSC